MLCCKKCVQSNRQAAFQFIELLFVIRKIRVQNKRWSAFQFIKLLFVKREVRDKRGAAFLVYSATFIIRKLIRSKEAAGCFLVKLVNFAIQKHACSIKAEVSLVIQKMYVQNKREAAF